MSRRVFKYPLKVEDSQEIEFTGFVDILSVAVQGDDMVLYAIVNPDDARKTKTEIIIRGTGHDLGRCMEGFTYMGSHVTHGGALVWHVWMGNVWEVKNEP